MQTSFFHFCHGKFVYYFLGTNPLDIDISSFLEGLSLHALVEIFDREQVIKN